jgi:hypothetical protein
VTLVRSSIPERDLGGVGLGCAAGAAVVLVLVLLCMSLHSFALAAGASPSARATSPRRSSALGGALVLSLLVSRSACRASLCSSLGGLLVVVPEQPRAYVLSQLTHSGGWLVLGMLGHIPAPFERIIRGGARARLARRCSLVSTSNSTTRTPVLGGGSGLVLGMLHVFHLPPTSAGGGSVSLLLFFYDRSHNCSLLRC